MCQARIKPEIFVNFRPEPELYPKSRPDLQLCLRIVSKSSIRKLKWLVGSKSANRAFCVFAKIFCETPNYKHFFSECGPQVHAKEHFYKMLKTRLWRNNISADHLSKREMLFQSWNVTVMSLPNLEMKLTKLSGLWRRNINALKLLNTINEIHLPVINIHRDKIAYKCFIIPEMTDHKRNNKMIASKPTIYDW